MSDLAHLLEVARAELAAAVDALDRLERLVDAKGFLWPADQAVLHAARAVLLEHGRRKSERRMWEDRVPEAKP